MLLNYRIGRFVLGCCVVELGCGSARVVSRLSAVLQPAAWIPP